MELKIGTHLCYARVLLRIYSSRAENIFLALEIYILKANEKVKYLKS